MKWRYIIVVGAYHDHNRLISRCGEVAEMASHRKASTVALWTTGKKKSPRSR
jgi:ribosomal protein S27AE